VSHGPYQLRLLPRLQPLPTRITVTFASPPFKKLLLLLLLLR
jgi:hypothetical protein